MSISFFRLGKFSSMILLKTFSGPLSWEYLFSILMLYGSYLSAIFSIVGLVYQYGHASEVVDSITVESDIDNFDKL